jgi:hypothetical protein
MVPGSMHLIPRIQRFNTDNMKVHHWTVLSQFKDFQSPQPVFLSSVLILSSHFLSLQSSCFLGSLSVGIPHLYPSHIPRPSEPPKFTKMLVLVMIQFENRQIVIMQICVLFCIISRHTNVLLLFPNSQF